MFYTVYFLPGISGQVVVWPAPCRDMHGWRKCRRACGRRVRLADGRGASGVAKSYNCEEGKKRELYEAARSNGFMLR